MFRRFWQYATKVFHLPKLIAGMRDSRIHPLYSTQHVWQTVALLLATDRGSLHAIEADRHCRQPRGVKRGTGPPCDDTLGRTFDVLDPEPLRQMLADIEHRLKRNKVLPLVWNLRFAAVDGHEFFSSRKRHCKDCQERTIKVDGEEVTEYYHQGVVCHLVGYNLALPLDVELLRPGEGEVSAACRLLERVFANYPRFFDAVLGDSLYCEAPFFNFCLQHGKHALAVLKGDERLLKRDAQLQFSQLTPVTFTAKGRQIQAWDLDGFTTMTGVDRKVRVLYSHEDWTTRSRVSGKWELTPESSDWWWATTISVSQLPMQHLWKAGHSRWDIENDAFNTLCKSRALNHCFWHSSRAILNFVLTIFVVYVLVQAFYQRNLKPAFRVGMTLIAFAKQLYAAWVNSGRILPWLKPLPPDTS